jgi:transcriptional regulator with XRE-family HTH domain
MIGDKIRELREEKNILLRQLAAQLDMDTAMLSKMERGDRFFKKEDIQSLSKIFKQNEKELLILFQVKATTLIVQR